MEYRNLEEIGKPLSRLVFGTGTAKVMSRDTAHAFYILDQAYEAGFRVFDTAFSYGNAEENLGSWIAARGIRDQVVILDKGCNPGQKGSLDSFSARTIDKQIRKSMKRLRTDHLDLYILHRDDERKPVDEIVEILNEYKEDGVIDRFGASNWSLARIRQANAYAEAHKLTGFTVCSPAYSMADLAHDPWGGSVTISGPLNKDYRDWLAANQMPVFTYSSLARGFLSGKYRTDGDKPIEECLPQAPILEYKSEVNRRRLAKAEKLANEKHLTVSQVCLAWLLAQPQNIYPIVSPTRAAHIRDNVKALEVALTPEEITWLVTDTE